MAQPGGSNSSDGTSAYKQQRKHDYKDEPVSEWAVLLLPDCTPETLQTTLPGLFQCFEMTAQYRQH